eukprot:349893-Chlamydomonas_euryale.AAC.9
MWTNDIHSPWQCWHATHSFMLCEVLERVAQPERGTTWQRTSPYFAKYGSGSRSHSTSTSEMTTCTPSCRNTAMSRIFSRPILANVGEPHPKSPVVRPDFMLKVLTCDRRRVAGGAGRCTGLNTFVPV